VHRFVVRTLAQLQLAKKAVILARLEFTNKTPVSFKAGGGWSCGAERDIFERESHSSLRLCRIWWQERQSGCYCHPVVIEVRVDRIRFQQMKRKLLLRLQLSIVEYGPTRANSLSTKEKTSSFDQARYRTVINQRVERRFLRRNHHLSRHGIRHYRAKG
jgi:hypothetical protein